MRKNDYSKTMKIDILEPKGYCAGVTNSIAIALKAKEEHPNKEVYILGMLVHNEQVISFLSSKGITVLESNKEKSLSQIAVSLENESIVVFTAHGHIKELDEIAINKNFAVYDAICPKVKQNINMIENDLKNGHQVIYIGILNHPEALAALSRGENVIFYNAKTVFDYSKVIDESPLVINQTTLNFDDLNDIHKAIKENIEYARIENEICNATRKRQEAIQNIDDDVDLIIVVGDKKSSNTNRLFDIAKAKHSNIESIMVKDETELSLDLFKNKNHVVISSGASTPLESINAICNYISKI